MGQRGLLCALVLAMSHQPLAAAQHDIDARQEWRSAPTEHADVLLAVDQRRASVVERIVELWGAPLAKSNAYVSIDEFRTRLLSLRADQLLAASLAGTLDGLREVIGASDASSLLAKPGVVQAKALGDSTIDVVYTPVTPCRLVETRGTFAAVYRGDGTVAHASKPFTSNEIRSYTVQGGNGVCLTQLPASLTPSAVQLQVFGLPTTLASGDIEILPQGATFGSTATMVYIASIPFNTVSTNAKTNLANKQISVQVRGGGAHLAIDVVGYFAAPTGTGGKFFAQGGNTFGTIATLATLDNQPLEIKVNNQRVMRYEPGVFDPFLEVVSPNVVGGHASNNTSPDGNFIGATIAGGGDPHSNCIDPTVNNGLRACANVTAGHWATISGGDANRASNFTATVGGGSNNTASGASSTIPGGFANIASGEESFAAGRLSEAAGDRSFALGYLARAFGNGSFIWADNRGFQFVNPPGFDNIFAARATGGAQFTVGIDALSGNPTWSCVVFNGNSGWSCTSDRDAKENFVEVDRNSILERVVALPLSVWNGKGADPRDRHMGPMAQDFYASFGLGLDETKIASGDISSVALAAIQGLHQLVQEKDARIAALENNVQAQQQELADLRQTMATLLAKIGSDVTLARMQ